MGRQHVSARLQKCAIGRAGASGLEADILNLCFGWKHAHRPGPQSGPSVRSGAESLRRLGSRQQRQDGTPQTREPFETKASNQRGDSYLASEVLDNGRFQDGGFSAEERTSGMTVGGCDRTIRAIRVCLAILGWHSLSNSPRALGDYGGIKDHA